MRIFFAAIKKGIGIVLGVTLLFVGGFTGIEDLQAPGSINIPIFIFSLAAILVGSILLYLMFKKNENM